ncbi:hypothetical protein B0T22DRAFT_271519 [Podospora appendiculata]|uniref:Uncharacterized protein n=1 Tax=Podospora appendiculata TaxID=314037 RepID=A0AAE1C9L9_9PEZI|nr:hypothetical protein B0T22DRAFT_271519 [Podospora appendiculata]
MQAASKGGLQYGIPTLRLGTSSPRLSVCLCFRFPPSLTRIKRSQNSMWPPPLSTRGLPTPPSAARQRPRGEPISLPIAQRLRAAFPAGRLDALLTARFTEPLLADDCSCTKQSRGGLSGVPTTSSRHYGLPCLVVMMPTSSCCVLHQGGGRCICRSGRAIHSSRKLLIWSPRMQPASMGPRLQAQSKWRANYLLPCIFEVVLRLPSLPSVPPCFIHACFIALPPAPMGRVAVLR